MSFYERRPWGWMIKFIHTPRFWIKFLRVRGRTSLQYHRERTEWHIGIYRVSPGEVHRMQHGWFLEVAVGRPAEEDIVRLEDDYQRR